MFRQSLTLFKSRGSRLLRNTALQARLSSHETNEIRRKIEIGVVTAVVGGGIGSAITHYVWKRQLPIQMEAELGKFKKELEMNFENHKKTMDFNDARNFLKFRTGHHIPSEDVYYEIDRPDVEKALKRDIEFSADVACVKNIIGDKGLGKSTTTAKTARNIDKENASKKANEAKIKLFYINASNTLRDYLEREYKLSFEKEEDAVRSLMIFIGRYGQTKPKNERVIVILDSPGGIEGDYAIKRLIKGMKDCVSWNYASFYCVTSMEKNIFATKESIKPFGDDTGRFKQVTQNEWIDFKLKEQEREEIIEKYQNYKGITFDQTEMKKINGYKSDKIGSFIDYLTTVAQSRKE